LQENLLFIILAINLTLNLIKMKKIVFIAFIFFSINTKAQISFEFALDSASMYSSGNPALGDELLMVNFEVLGDQYVRINRHGQNISIYNMSHALLKTISFSSFPQASSAGNYADMLYFSQHLFNTDSLIEFMYIANTGAPYTGIYNENGTLLFSDTGLALIHVSFPSQQYPIYNTTSGTKMILSYQNMQAKVFDLGGTLTTAIDRVNNPTNTGLGNAYPNPTANTTTIPYTLPSGTTQGQLVFYNTQGSEVKRFTVDNTFSSLLISTTDIPAGTYYYNLQISGDASATKKMVVVK
jgi:type IX secretion system substrate protein